MLDKSIAFKNMIMRAEGLNPAFAGSLPEGFSIRTFSPGDEAQWAMVETAVGEFDTEEEAKDYFVQTYLPYPDELRCRCFFVIAPDGTYAGTCTAWFMVKESGETGVIHWFGVRPEYQGMGLGKALLLKAMRHFEALNAYPVYLHTQTWSHKAIGLYANAGFCLMKTDTFEGNPNDYDEAMEVLKGAVSPQRLAAWASSAK